MPYISEYGVTSCIELSGLNCTDDGRGPTTAGADDGGVARGGMLPVEELFWMHFLPQNLAFTFGPPFGLLPQSDAPDFGLLPQAEGVSGHFSEAATDSTDADIVDKGLFETAAFGEAVLVAAADGDNGSSGLLQPVALEEAVMEAFGEAALAPADGDNGSNGLLEHVA